MPSDLSLFVCAATAGRLGSVYGHRPLLLETLVDALILLRHQIHSFDSLHDAIGHGQEICTLGVTPSARIESQAISLWLTSS